MGNVCEGEMWQKEIIYYCKIGESREALVGGVASPWSKSVPHQNHGGD